MSAWLLGLPLAGAAWFSWRYAWWRPAVDYRFPRLLMYHMISEPKPGARFNGLRVAPAMFERQLRWLRNEGWTGFTVSELFEQGGALPEKSFAITFDDGYADNLTAALPLLERYDCRATLYLVVDRFDRDWSVARKAHHDEGELMREAKLSDAQLRELLASGRIELGSHGLTHPNMLTLDEAAATRELSGSKQLLEERFGVPVKSFAYPFGLYRAEQVRLVADAGYSSAVTTTEGIDDPRRCDPLQLRRIKVSGRDNMLAFRMRMRAGRRGWLR